LLFSISDSKRVMEQNLKQMTSIVLKLDQKVKREVSTQQEEGKRTKEGKYYQVEQEEKMSPLQKELEYKTLTLYTL
jgi:ribosomal protein L28